MFAFAIWDKERQELFLARDRYGVKPLYYTLQGNILLFGSEIKAILTHPAYRTAIDKAALLEYFTFQNFFTEKTLFQGVRLLPAGTCMRVPLAATDLPEPGRYWDYHFSEPDNPEDDREYVEELARLFWQAVNRQL